MNDVFEKPQFTEFKAHGAGHLLHELESEAYNFWKYESGNVTRILLEGTEYIFVSKTKKFPQRSLFLFRVVKTQAEAFVSSHTFTLPAPQPAKVSSPDANTRGVLIETDINHAYWRIAYNLGVLSEKTYLAGLDEEFKEARLAALSSLGMPRVYRYFEDGLPTPRRKVIGMEESLQKVYKLIRYTCYHYMHDLMNQLGSHFVEYATDAITYRRSRANIGLVEDYLQQHKLSWKHYAL